MDIKEMKRGTGARPIIRDLIYHQMEFGLHSFLQKLFINLTMNQHFLGSGVTRIVSRERRIPAFIEQNKNSFKDLKQLNNMIRVLERPHWFGQG